MNVAGVQTLSSSQYVMGSAGFSNLVNFGSNVTYAGSAPATFNASAIFNSNVNLNSDVTVGGNFNVIGNSTMVGTVTMSNNLTVGANALSTFGGNVVINAPQYLQVQSIKSDAAGVGTFTLDAGLTIINGNLEVLGTLTSVNTTTITVEDRLIMLAHTDSSNYYNSNYPMQVDGLSTNDKSGIQVFGLPSGITDMTDRRYEKSLKWNYGTLGVSALNTSNLGAESFWEVLGGSLRFTCYKSNNDTISYGFRINERDELEFNKYQVVNGVATAKRVAKMGAQLL
jgi:hypothetical protein